MGRTERSRPVSRCRSVRPPATLEEYNPNCVGGDINGGVQDLRQLFSRPARAPNPYSIPSTGIFICSSSTPPGPPSAPPPAEFHNATAFVLIGRRPGVHRPPPVLGSGRHPEKTTSTVDLRRLYDGFALPTCPGPSLPPPAAAVAMVKWEVILGYLNDIRGMLSQGSLPEQRALLASFLRSVNWHDSVSSGGVH